MPRPGVSAETPDAVHADRPADSGFEASVRPGRMEAAPLGAFAPT